jgi:hypothetical protein
MDYEAEKLELDHKIFEAKIALKRVEDAIDYLVRKREVLEEANQFYPELFGGDIEARSRAQDEENEKTYWTSNDEERRQMLLTLVHAERASDEEQEKARQWLAENLAQGNKTPIPADAWFLDEHGDPRLERHRDVGHNHGI